MDHRCYQTGKVKLELKDAETRAEELTEETGEKFRSYYCKYCEKFHLSKMSLNLAMTIQKQKKARKEKRFKLEVDYWEEKLK